jgi:short-subunit dehydrogenase
MISLNVNTLAGLSHRMIPYLRKKTPSYILNVASTAAYQAVPTMTTYAATKAFVVLFSRGLRWELKGSGISVSCLSPGATSTGFIDRAGMEVLKERAEKFSMTPEAVARIAIRELFNGKAEIIPGFVNWISVKFTYFLPKYIVEKIAAGLYVQ